MQAQTRVPQIGERFTYNLNLICLIEITAVEIISDLLHITCSLDNGTTWSPGYTWPNIVDFLSKHTLVTSANGLASHDITAGFPTGGGLQAAQQQGLAAWVPDPPLPPGQSNEFFGVKMAGLLNKCTCGVDTLGYGNHSDWCDKYKKEEKI